MQKYGRIRNAYLNKEELKPMKFGCATLSEFAAYVGPLSSLLHNVNPLILLLLLSLASSTSTPDFAFNLMDASSPTGIAAPLTL